MILIQRIALAATVVLGSLGPAMADPAYPQKPIQMVIPFAPGGSTDVLGRVLATRLGERLGQSIVVENRPGGGTMLAASYVSKAAPDGYTVMLATNTTMTLNPAIRETLSYDPVGGFTPLGQIGNLNLVMVAHNSTPQNNVKELLAAAKAQPDKYVYGSFGTGSAGHFAGEMLKAASGATMVHVPFNGSGPSLNALLGGHIPMAMDTVVASLPHIKSKRLKPIAVVSAQRSSLLPDVPTVAESGITGVDMSAWFALLAPPQLPQNIQLKLQSTLEEVLKEPQTIQRLLELGYEPQYATGEAVTQRIKSELPRMKELAKRANITAE